MLDSGGIAGADELGSDPLLGLFCDASPRRFGTGTIVFGEGDVSNRFVLVVSGRLRVSAGSEDGLVRSVIARLREAVSKSMHRLGERGLIEVHRRSVTVLDLDGLRKRAL